MINVVWDNPEQTIIRLDYSEPIDTWEEYREAVNQAHDMARSVNYTVHIVHNTGHVKMPAGKQHRAVEELSITFNDVPDNVGILTSVTLANFERRITRVIPQILLRADEIHFYMVDSLETAYNLIDAFNNGSDLSALA